MKRTPLHDLHLELGAKMVPFAGYEMPVHYPTGIIAEHLNVRTQAGLFDVSHMGQITVTGENAPEWLETLLPTDIIGLKEGAQRYSFFTTESGGILDDLMVYRLGDEYCLVVNAANKDADVAYLEKNAIPGIGITLNEDRALLALQGDDHRPGHRGAAGHGGRAARDSAHLPPNRRRGVLWHQRGGRVQARPLLRAHFH